MIKFKLKDKMNEVHKEIEMLLNIAVDGLGLSQKKCLEVFTNFETALLNHLTVEEETIFSSVDLGDNDIQQTIRRLCDEHVTMKKLLAEAKIAMLNEKKVDIVKFMSLLKSHQAMEDKILYPELDKILSLEEKLRIKKEIDNK